MTQVQCRCGAVEVEITAEPIVQFFCHCDDCPGGAWRRLRADVGLSRRRREGRPRLSDGLETEAESPRHLSRECGTRLFIDVEAQRLRGVNGYLLPPGKFQPAFHVQCQFAVRPVIDDLPHYKGMPKRFGGSDETVGW